MEEELGSQSQTTANLISAVIETAMITLSMMDLDEHSVAFQVQPELGPGVYGLASEQKTLPSWVTASSRLNHDPFFARQSRFNG